MSEYVARATISSAVVPLDAFLRGYLECAEWSGISDDERPVFDASRRPAWAHKAIREAYADCKAFREANALDLVGTDDAHAGHDFWLTRNRHGAGYWDGDYPAEAGRRLTDAAHVYGSVNVTFYNGLLRFQ